MAKLLALDLGHGAGARVPVHHLLLAGVRQPGKISKLSIILIYYAVNLMIDIYYL